MFSTGSITWASALAHNNYENNVASITGNVLRRFVDPARFEGHHEVCRSRSPQDPRNREFLDPDAGRVKLAARAWLPVDAERDPVPAILGIPPYRKRDGTVWRDQVLHPYVARHGYAVVRLDMRGTGDSEGLIFDEYTMEEQDDGLAALAGIASQPWCSGRTGMIGISWGRLQRPSDRRPGGHRR